MVTVGVHGLRDLGFLRLYTLSSFLRFPASGEDIT